MKQFVITPAAGKRLIGKQLLDMPQWQQLLKKELLLLWPGQPTVLWPRKCFWRWVRPKEFRRNRFYRGIILPPARPTTSTGRLSDEGKFPGDVVIRDGVFQRGKTIFDVIDDLREGGRNP